MYTYIHATHLIMLGTEFEFRTSEIYSQCTDGIRYLYMSNDSPMVRVLFGYMYTPTDDGKHSSRELFLAFAVLSSYCCREDLPDYINVCVYVRLLLLGLFVDGGPMV